MPEPLTITTPGDRQIVITRSFEAPRELVFLCYSKPELLRRWYGMPDWTTHVCEIDFRVGGREHLSGKRTDFTSTFDGVYHDIVPDQRIIYSYDMHLDRRHISVSLATVELKPEGSGTRLILTELGAYLDGHDQPSMRLGGTEMLLDQLGAELQRQLVEERR